MAAVTIMSELTRRAAATNKTFGKYRSRPFAWDARSTCIHMVRFHLRNMGYRPPAMPDFRSALSARKALVRLGFDSVTSLLDSLLPRIAPAEMMVGDIAALDGDEGFESIVISSGSKLVGYHGDDPTGIKPHMLLQAPAVAWRV